MVPIIALVFILGYSAIIFEHSIKINKAASAIFTGVVCWAVFALSETDNLIVKDHLSHHFIDIGGILFFLLGAMVIVELVDAHDGFVIITDRIQSTRKKKLVWIIGLLTFFLSAILDNLTTTIVMVSLLRKLVPEARDRLLFASLVIIAANAGGAWSPIGDVTTTMLWIGGQITTFNIIFKTFIPSLVSFIIPAILISYQLKGTFNRSEKRNELLNSTAFERKTVFVLGVFSLVFVPVFKTVTHLPPYMGILFGLGLMWIVTELIHHKKSDNEKGLLSVNHALRKVDTPSVLFFLGILLSVSALQSTGILGSVATFLDQSVGDIRLITIIIGFLSAIVDNVPLVAAAQGMYSLDQFPVDHYFWQFLAYCAGTGGSILVIGSAAGVAAMGMEKIQFFWYMKKISWLALIGYLAGALAFLVF